MQVKSFMMQYEHNLVQDAIELNWSTAKRAHGAVLTEMERGHTSWENQVGVDRIRLRFTQRAIKNTQQLSFRGHSTNMQKDQ